MERLEDGAAIQRDPDWLEEWPDRNLMILSKTKCKVLPVGRMNILMAVEQLC